MDETAAKIAPQTTQPMEKPWGLLSIPPFPPVALRVLQLVSVHDTRLDQLSKMICTDQAFSTEILTIANSPLYTAGHIRSVLQAAVLIGLERVKGIAVTIGVRAYLNESLKIPALRACWRHSLACALIGEELAIASLSDQDIAYTAGIVHDIGRLALAVMQPQRYSEFLETLEVGPVDILQREREWFEVDHCAAGRLMVTAWKLPHEFMDITSQHHAKRNFKALDLLALVRFSCQMADTLGFAAVRPFNPASYRDLLAELPERERDRLGPNAEKLTFQIASKINSIESV